MLELKNVCAGYGNREILTDVSFSFSKSEFVSVVGPNGSGKSTLLKTAMGILPLTSGGVYVDGENLRGLSQRRIAEKIAYLSQGRNVPDMTVGQLVLHGRFPHLSYPRQYSENDKQIVLRAMSQLGISEYADRPLSALSGGMRQNAYIAMALSQDTDYILLDEPTTYLDIFHQLELMKTFKKLSDMGKGVAAVLHDLPLAFSFSDRVIVLNDGKVVADGAPSEIYGDAVIYDVFGIELDYSESEQNYRYKYYR